MKNPGAVRLEQAPSAVSRLFRDCFAILGLLRRPTPDSCVLFTKLTCNPRSRNDVGLPTSMLRQQHSRISKSDRIELARFRSSFVLRRISGVHDKSSPIQFSGGNCLKVHTSQFARRDSKGMKSRWRRFGRAERPTSPLANFCFSMPPFNE